MSSLIGRPYALLLLILAAALALVAVFYSRVAQSGLPAAAALLLVCLAAALAVGYLPFRAIDRRFRALLESAEDLARGDLRRRATVDAHDEIARLARTLNDLAERFDFKVGELQAERDGGEAILGNIPLGLALTNRNLSIRHANGRFWSLVGLDPPAADVRLAAARQPVLEEMATEALRQGRPLVREVTFYLAERHEYEVRVNPIPAREGARPEALLISIEDLSPERKMAALRREFVANASHELKTPLTSIRGYAETLLSGGLEDETNRARFVETIRTQATRLESLVEDLLELADLERPDAPMELKDWDLGEVIQDLAETFQEVAARSGLRLTYEMRAGHRAIVDRRTIELAVRNLLDNAIKYTERGGVTVRVESDDDVVRVRVTDTGRGIASDHVPRLFERFYRVDRGRSRSLGGTGLGLAIVKHAVQLHDGHVGVESQPGTGSTFWFEVPRRGPVGAAAAPRSLVS